MNDASKTKSQLIAELKALRQELLSEKKAERGGKTQPQSEFFQNLTDGVFLADVENGMIVYTNASLGHMFGYEHAELIGKHISILNAAGEKTSEEVSAEIINSLTQTGMWKGNIRNMKKDGTIFWSRAKISTFDHPQFGRVWTSRQEDITLQKQGEESLLKSEERYKTLIEWLPEPAAVYQNGLLIYFNLAATQALVQQQIRV